jgi:hypothetical protein
MSINANIVASFIKLSPGIETMTESDIVRRFKEFEKRHKDTKVRSIENNPPLFATFSYNTLKYFGLHYELVPVKLAPSEIEFLKSNTLKNTIIQTQDLTVVTIMGNIRRVIDHTKPYDRDTKPYDRGGLDYPNIRYIDNITLEYMGKIKGDRTKVEKMVTFNMNELKVLVKKNFGKVRGDNRRRQTWVYAYIDTVLLGFNTFAVRSQLNDDLLREIRKYL